MNNRKGKYMANYAIVEADAIPTHLWRLYNQHDFLIRHNGRQKDMLVAELKLDTRMYWGSIMKRTLATWIKTNHTLDVQLAHAAMGICSEITEVTENSTEDELGDLYYYRNMFCYLSGMSLYSHMFDEIVFNSDKESQPTLENIVKFVSDVGKRAGFHDNFESEKCQHRLQCGLKLLDEFMFNIEDLYSYSSKHIIEQNLKKLAKRHGNSFTKDY